ncbi:MAG: diguanylate cyclase [Pseudomonadota bacterium]
MTQDTRNSCRAKIACVSSDKGALSSLIEAYGEIGYRAAPAHRLETADLGLIDLRGVNVTTRRARAMCDALRRKSPESSLIFLVDPYAPLDRTEPLTRFGEVIPADDILDHVIARSRSILRMRNLAEEAGERLKSLTAVNRVVEFPVISTQTTPPRVLLAGAPGPNAIAAINSMAPVIESCICVLTAAQAMRALKTYDADCMVFLPDVSDRSLTALACALQRHPDYARLPSILIGRSVDHVAALARANLADYLIDSHIAARLPGRVIAAARRGRLAASMRQFLSACAGDGVRDPVSGAYTPTFLTEHGGRLSSRADQTARSLSAISVRLTERDAADNRKTVRYAMETAAGLLKKITRSEDLVARISFDTFAVLCSATNEGDASRIGKRIEGVLSAAGYRQLRSERPYGVHVTAHAVEREPGSAIAELIGKAFAISQQADVTSAYQRQYQR